MTPSRKQPPKPVIGWREWIQLPDLAETRVKAKIDTGARTSALHAFGLRIVEEEGRPMARFELHPRQRSASGAVLVTHPIHGFRRVRSSNGKSELRPVIVTRARLGPVSWPIEITLTSRDAMGFRMLLGRAAVRRVFLVDPGRAYLLSSRNNKTPSPQEETGT